MNESGRNPAASERDEASTEQRGQPWTGSTVIAALQTALTQFEPHVAAINALNVFPVPDGDTGTNMYLTIQAAVQEAVQRNHSGAGEVLASAAHGALMGARGNSGVILYQILAGLAEAATGHDTLDGTQLAAGLRRASDLAYRAVIRPVEGTMLTVIREAADAAEDAARDDTSCAAVLSAALVAARESLERTPNLLDILRQAGVVDAGGQGLVVLLSSLHLFAQGETANGDFPTIRLATPRLDACQPAQAGHGDGSFGYCINFVLTGDAIPVERFRAHIEHLGDSAVIVGDGTTLKVHTHAERPGLVLEAALDYGELHQVQIDNMDAQAAAARAGHTTTHTVATEPASATEIGIVAVASGDGIALALRGLGAHAIVPGGPTNNPSTQEILAVVERLAQHKVIILPNDPNIIATATHVGELSTKEVRVVPTRSIPQAISALAAFHFETDLDDNVEAMSEALEQVTSLAMTRASRDAEIDGVQARQGQFIGLIDGRMRAAGDDPSAVVLRLLELADAEDAELLTLFVGAPSDEDAVTNIAGRVEAAYPNLSIEIAAGDQPHYDLLIALE